MKISVERKDWTEHQPELVVLVGDPYMDTIGEVPDAVAERVARFGQGFADKTLSQEIYFTGTWNEQKSFDCVYYHTSTHQGFTYPETLKTFLASALRNAVKTGRKKVALLLKGAQGEGLVDQLVEGALVGTWSFREYKKDQSDAFEGVELILCLPSPPMTVPETPEADSEVVAEEASSTKATVAISESDLPEEVAEAEQEDSSSEQADEDESTETSEEPAAEESDGSSDTTEEEAVENSESEEDKADAAEEPAEPVPAPEEKAEAAPPPEPVVDEEALAALLS